MPLGLDRDVRLVHPPRGTNRLGETPPALLELRNAAGYPPKHGRMGHLDAALGHHFDWVPVRQPIRDVPPHAQLDDVGGKHSFAVDRVTGNRPGHSAPRARLSASLPAALDAPEPSRLTLEHMLGASSIPLTVLVDPDDRARVRRRRPLSADTLDVVGVSASNPTHHRSLPTGVVRLSRQWRNERGGSDRSGSHGRPCPRAIGFGSKEAKGQSADQVSLNVGVVLDGGVSCEKPLR